MNNNINEVLSKIGKIYEAADEIFYSWDGPGLLQVPNFMGMLAVKLDIEDKEIRNIDPLIRFYLKHHADFYIARGAKGGIDRRSNKTEKDNIKNQKDIIKKMVEEEFAIKLASMQANPSISPVNLSDDDDIFSDIDE